jgi:predicted alpha/beta hydrolase
LPWGRVSEPIQVPHGLSNMADGISSEDTTIAARDGYSLAATVFQPSVPVQRAVLINSATAVPRKIYRGFAGFLAHNGFAAITYDYRGVGGSRPRSLRGFPARMRDWAALDVSAAVEFARQTWPAAPLTYVGHSFGGQALGLIPNNTAVSRALLVSAQAAYWRAMPAPESYRVFVLMNLGGRAVAHTIGYVPGWMGIGEDLPKGVFLDWADWVLKPRYFFDDASLAELKNFPNYRGALRAIGMNDDRWATAAMIDLLVSGFTSAQAERTQIEPRDVGASRIDHFGFFRPDHCDTLWRDAAEWLAK